MRKLDVVVRMFLLILGWSSILGSLGDGAIALYALWVIGSNGWLETWMTVDTFLREHINFLYWVKQVATRVMPQPIVSWLFALPALAYFPARIVLSCLIGWWALAKARTLPPSHPGKTQNRAAA